LPSQPSLVARTDPATLPGVAHAALVETLPDGWSRWDLKLAAPCRAADLLETCTSQGFPLRAFETRTPNLHDVFIHLVGPEAERVT
jgi:ABC-2 type transport system ATP-binding protein